MTYTEFIIGIENNIAKANCNKLNMEEYEEKQKQIYNQIRAEAIDDCKELTFREVVYCDSLNDRTEFRELAEQLKAGENNV